MTIKRTDVVEKVAHDPRLAIPDCEIASEWDLSAGRYRIEAKCLKTGKTASYYMAKSEIMLATTREELTAVCTGILVYLAADIAELRKTA